MPEAIKIECLGKNATEVARILKILSNERRVKLLCHLSGEEMSAGDLGNKIECGQSSTSQHLSYLRNTNLVKTRQVGTTIYYSLTEPARQLLINLYFLVRENNG